MKLPGIHRFGALAAVIATSFGLIACGTNGFPLMDASTDVSTDNGIARIEVLPDTAYIGQVGQSTQMAATVFDAQDSTVVNATVVWSTADPSVATVTTDGVVTGVGQGETTVAASSGDVEGTAVVVVTTLQPLGGAP